MVKKKKTRLPRVTLLALSGQDLVRFAEAVESLRCLVQDLAVEVQQLKEALAARKARDARTRKPAPPAEDGPPAG